MTENNIHCFPELSDGAKERLRKLAGKDGVVGVYLFRSESREPEGFSKEFRTAHAILRLELAAKEGSMLANKKDGYESVRVILGKNRSQKQGEISYFIRPCGQDCYLVIAILRRHAINKDLTRLIRAIRKQANRASVSVGSPHSPRRDPSEPVVSPA